MIWGFSRKIIFSDEAHCTFDEQNKIFPPGVFLFEEANERLTNDNITALHINGWVFFAASTSRNKQLIFIFMSINFRPLLHKLATKIMRLYIFLKSKFYVDKHTTGKQLKRVMCVLENVNLPMEAREYWTDVISHIQLSYCHKNENTKYML